jgi:hypothetical protein
VVVDAEVSQTNKTTLRSERSGARKKRKKVREKWKKTKKDLTGPTLLEITGFRTSRDLTFVWLSVAAGILSRNDEDVVDA